MAKSNPIPDDQIQKWDTNVVQTLESMYGSCDSLKEKVLFITNCFLEFNSNYTEGEFDPTMICEESYIQERYELLSFLEKKFLEIREDLSDNGDLFNEIRLN